MNANLPPEVLWGLALMFFVGLWLVWKSAILGCQVDLLNEFVNWCSKREIVIPSIFFITTPFIVPYLIRKVSESAPIDRIAPILSASGLGIYMANTYLDQCRKREEQKKIAKLIIVSIQEHLISLKMIFRYLEKGSIRDSEVEMIDAEIERIQENGIYKLALMEIEVFDFQEVEVISEYNKEFNLILRNMKRRYEKQGDSNFRNVISSPFSKLEFEAFEIEAELCIVVLRKKILRDGIELNEYKEAVETRCSNLKSHGQDWRIKKTTRRLLIESLGIVITSDPSINL